MKKIITSILISMVLLISLCIPVMANETENGKVITAPVITIDKNADQNLKDKNADDLDLIIKPLSDLAGGALIIRNGTSEECQVYLSWSGNLATNSLRFKSLTVKSTSSLFPEEYETFGNGSSYKYYDYVGSTSGTVFIGYADIPTDVDRVKVSVKDLQYYIMMDSVWISAGTISGGVDIN